jgi:hypothetical protein
MPLRLTALTRADAALVGCACPPETAARFDSPKACLRAKEQEALIGLSLLGVTAIIASGGGGGGGGGGGAYVPQP